jgi:hypothetical protein
MKLNRARYLDGKHRAEDGTTVNFDGRFTVAGEPRIAYYLLGWATEWTEESYELDCDSETHVFDRVHDDYCYLYNKPEQYDRTDQVIAVMVGDDRQHVVNVEDLTEISGDDVCPGCGAVPSCYGSSDD